MVPSPFDLICWWHAKQKHTHSKNAINCFAVLMFFNSLINTNSAIQAGRKHCIRLAYFFLNFAEYSLLLNKASDKQFLGA